MRSTTFWKITFGLFACGFSMNLMGTHCMPMLQDHGFDATTSALGIGLIGLVAIPSTMVLGRIADKVERRKLLSAIYGVRGLGFIGLLVAGSVWQLYRRSCPWAAWCGRAALHCLLPSWRMVYGVKKVGGAIRLGLSGPSSGCHAQRLAGWLGYQTHHTHWVAFGAAALLLVLAAGVAWSLRPAASPAATAA